MKTTVDIPEGLLKEARQTAAREGITLKALLGEGLRLALERHRSAGFELRRASFRGEGTQPDIDLEDGQQIAQLIYRGRGE